jgi:ABC-type lipoprotein release transport system permease subunit
MKKVPKKRLRLGAVAVTSTALLATWIPVRRATEIQLTVALRAE